MAEKVDIKKRLRQKQLLLELGYTLNEVAEKAGVVRQTVYNFFDPINPTNNQKVHSACAILINEKVTQSLEKALGYQKESVSLIN